jgi:hypothetical protein
MTMVDHVLREDSLKADGNAMLLDVGLPWFRSVPISCVNGLMVTIGEHQFGANELQILHDGHWFPLNELPNSDLGEWYLQDRKQIRVPVSINKNELQKVRVHFDMAIPNIFLEPNKPALLPMIREAELQVR